MRGPYVKQANKSIKNKNKKAFQKEKVTFARIMMAATSA